MIRRMRARKNNERGSILVMSTAGLVLAVISAALAVDLGRLAQDKRTDQKVADLAALDASRDLTQACARARASVVRNGFSAATLDCVDPATNPAADVVLGNYVAGTFVPSATGDAVQVTVSTDFKTAFPFVEGPDGLTVRAVATATPYAGFGIGSALTTIDSSRVALLNPLIGRMIGGSDLTTSLVSWQGLATGSVTLEALRTELAAMGFNVGDVDQLLGAEMTLAQFYQATASALTAGGDTANATLLNSFKVAATNETKMKIGDWLTVDQGSENVALASSFNVFQLVTAAAEASAVNGNNFIDVSNVAITVPGVTSTSLRLKVIEGMQFAFGGEGATTSTGQVELTVTPNLNLDVIGLLRVTNSLPINITAAGATGTLKDIRCTASPGITVTADPKAYDGPGANTTLEVKALAGLIHLLEVNTTTATPSVDGPPVDLTFNFPDEFSPPAATKHAGSSPIGLQSASTITGTAANVNALGLLTVGLTQAGVVNAVLNALRTVVGSVDNRILTPLLAAMGLDVGSADVLAVGGLLGFNPASCGQPRLIG